MRDCLELLNVSRQPPGIRTSRRVAVALSGTACVVALAACGSSSGSTNASNSSGQSAGIRFAHCMRSHGVPNFPDPGSGGGGFQIPAGANPRAPAFQAAQRACFKLLPGGGPGGGGNSEARRLQLLRLAECMRAHGVASFPDPSNSPPSGPPAGGGVAFGGGGSFLAIPQSLINSPGFRQAASACKFPGFGGRGPKASVL
jgi:hypothetical protein